METRGTAGSESGPQLKTLMGYWLYLHISVITLTVKVPENRVHVVRERLPLPSNCLSQGVAFFLVCRTGPAHPETELTVGKVVFKIAYDMLFF